MMDSEELAAKLSDHEHRLKSLESQTSRVELRFEKHMDKEEKALDDIHTAMRGVRDEVASIVMKGMEDRAELKEYFTERQDSYVKAMHERINEVENKSVTKESVRTILVAVGIVFSAIAWLSSHYSAKSVTEKQAVQINGMMEKLTTEIHEHKKVGKQ